jgi:hypothetical protein
MKTLSALKFGVSCKMAVTTIPYNSKPTSSLSAMKQSKCLISSTYGHIQNPVWCFMHSSNFFNKVQEEQPVLTSRKYIDLLVKGI